jgi:prophage maintenance system killer protein
MYKKSKKSGPLLLDLSAVHDSFIDVELHWQEIDDELDRLEIGRKDTPFNTPVRERMESAFAYLQRLLESGEKPFDANNIGCILELNNLVHFGQDIQLRVEYKKAIAYNSDNFYRRIEAIQKWYTKHDEKDDVMKLAAKVYVAILARPQLFTEGNHRTGSLVANWILMYHGHPPFVLSRQNAIAYFYPSSQIKKFVDQASWRGQFQLPQWHKKYGKFLEQYTDPIFVRPLKDDKTE